MFTETTLTLDTREPTTALLFADVRTLHRLVMSGFPAVTHPAPRAALQVLYRLEVDGLQRGQVTVRSADAPQWAALPPGVTVEHQEPRGVPSGSEPILVTCDVNATRDVPMAPDGAAPSRHTRRVALTAATELQGWWQRQGERHGFQPLHTFMTPLGYRHGTDGLTFGLTRFVSALRITDAERFAAAWVQGIGKARAFGAGMLVAAPDVATPAAVS